MACVAEVVVLDAGFVQCGAPVRVCRRRQRCFLGDESELVVLADLRASYRDGALVHRAAQRLAVLKRAGDHMHLVPAQVDLIPARAM